MYFSNNFFTLLFCLNFPSHPLALSCGPLGVLDPTLKTPILDQTRQDLIVCLFPGKTEALNAGAIAPLLQLVVSENTTVCANALRALTVLAEVPRARAQLLEHVPLLNTRLTHPNTIIQRAASTAIEVISWKP